MNRVYKNITNYLAYNYEIIFATVIFIGILMSGMKFHQMIILMLEFVVIMEVVKMISDFIRQEKLRLRYVIDIFIIFLIRDVIIQASHESKDYIDIGFLLIVIFVFFIFRILAIKFSPGIIKIPRNTVIEYEDEEIGKDKDAKKTDLDS